MSLLIHQFEEYALPGGFPLIWNAGVSGERENYHAYPMNKQGSAFSNLSFWLVYILLFCILQDTFSDFDNCLLGIWTAHYAWHYD